VPVGLLVVFLCWENLRKRETPVTRSRMDLVGMGLLIVWAGALQLMLDRGKNADWFGSPWIVALAIIAFAGFCGFILWEMTEDHPILDLALFKSRNFALGTLVFCLGNGVFLANMLVLPLWLQTQLAYTATWAGLVSAPTGVVSVLLTPLAARALARTDARLVASVAFLASALSYYLRAGLTADASFVAIALPLMVQGIANAGFFVATVTILLDDVPGGRIPMASGLSNFVRIIVSGFAVSLATTLWDRREALHQSRMADMATGAPLHDTLSTLQGLGLSELAGKAVVTRGMEGQAYLLASIDVFHVSMWLCLALTGVVWLCHRTRKPAEPVVAAD
jgi:DHA2 family multidrug resistance protein